MKFQAKKITDKVYWVGAVDWTIKDFHGYATHKGTTYNAYLILAEKPTLIDTVKEPFFEEMMDRISSIIDPQKIEIIISNHAELDHSGSLPKAIKAINPQVVYTSTLGEKALKAHLHESVDQILSVVKNGSSIDLGDRTISFLETRMLHWPDSMFSILNEEGIVFTNDAFGMHLAINSLYAKDYSKELLMEEGERYFANILLPYTPLILKLLEQLQDKIPTFKMLLPDHGPIWCGNEEIQWILNLYSKWAKQEPTKNVIVLYDSMWESTKTMASYIVEGLRVAGLNPMLIKARDCHRSDIITLLASAGALIVGSPTLNNQIYPALLDSLTYIKGLKPKNKFAATFGSFGWSGEAPKLLETFLTEAGFTLIENALKIQYVPTQNDKETCLDFGLKIGKNILEKIEK